jgi:hypothetical protein
VLHQRRTGMMKDKNYPLGCFLWEKQGALVQKRMLRKMRLERPQSRNPINDLRLIIALLKANNSLLGNNKQSNQCTFYK